MCADQIMSSRDIAIVYSGVAVIYAIIFAGFVREWWRELRRH
jgi:hypothetical protein